MAEQPLVSIIIPTYNRAHLIGETLDSILAQTYENWECIVVDDGSCDDTDAVMQEYCEKDSRFKYYHRPEEHLAGGSGARNYGFKKSLGDYIQWFDSDDLMVKEKIELKVKTILVNDVDFVISQTKYFNRADSKGYSYNYEDSNVDFLSYATTYISWFTPDIFLKRNLASQISFNERLQAGQEYNFSCKLLLITNNLKKIEKFLTLRRDHENSIGKNRQRDKEHYWVTTFNLHWLTLLELDDLLKNKLPLEYEKYASYKCIRSYFEMNKKVKLNISFYKKLFGIYKLRSINFCFAILTNSLFGKKEYFLKQLKKS